MKIKTIEYYEAAIIRLKNKIKRLQAEKRVAILLKRERKELASKGASNE